MLHVPRAVVDPVGVLEVEIVIPSLDRIDRDPPSDLALLTLAVISRLVRLAPPLLLSIKLLDPDRLGLVVTLGPSRIRMLVIPHLLGRSPLGKEKQIRADPRIRIEHAIGEPNDGVQIALGQQRFLDPRFDSLSKQRPVWQNQSSPTTGLEHLHEQHQKQIGGLARAEFRRIVRFNPVFFHPPKRRIGHDDIHPFLRAPIAQRSC